MSGIVSYGSYIPYRRLKRAAIAAVLGTPAGRGERAVASFDEDSVSMAVEALRDALKHVDIGKVNSLFFATTTPPYAEKLNAAMIGAAALLPAEIRAADMTGSIRAGLSALLQGADSARGGGYCAVTIADARLGAPEGKVEQSGGDGAAAFVFGNEGVIAEVEASASLTREYLDTWRVPSERFGHSWEERFALTQAYHPMFVKVIRDVLEKAKATPGDLAKVIVDAPN
ncbi:MAG: 3-hydroxy-3-methylglutaryl CoA synthase, partial [Candidatus Binataceae bacterium]